MKHYSILIPAYNCSQQLKNLLETCTELDYPKDHYEIVVINDGSSDDTAEVAKSFDVRVIEHPQNLGRVMTRETGAKAAKHENLVFIDARLNIEKDLLKAADALGHMPLMGVGGSDKYRSIIDRVFYCIRRKVYKPYEPQHLYHPELWISKDSFDGKPKGTGLLIIDRELFLSCALQEKSQDVNDDTKLLRNIVEKAKILRHTDITFFYEHRQDWGELLRHTFYRGPKFLDYYLSPGGPLFIPYIFLLLVLVGLLSSCLFVPSLLLYLCIAPFIVMLGAAIYLSEELSDIPVCMVFFPPVGLAFCSGIAFAQWARWFKLRNIIRH
jgi:glycosyltransferase involved in cell wall biosynthesis